MLAWRGCRVPPWGRAGGGQEADRRAGGPAWQPERMEVLSDRRYRFAVPPTRLWSVATSVERYRDWWPWLRGFDADGFGPGQQWTCTVQPPLPYVVRFDVVIGEVRPTELVRASLTGDIVGSADLEIRPVGVGCEARLVSRLAPGNGFLRLAARVARPVVRFGHDWVLDSGARQFSERALSDADSDS